MRASITPEIANAMHSFGSAEEIPDFEQVCEFISKSGNEKACGSYSSLFISLTFIFCVAWLKDKWNAKFVIPAIYRPHSLIPLCFWLASPSSTNGNEQAHRSINRDGIDLTLLSGIMRAMQYDFRVMSSLALLGVHGISTRDQPSTEYRRAQTSISRQGKYMTFVLLVEALLTLANEQRPHKPSPQRSPQKEEFEKSSALSGRDVTLTII